MEVFLAIVRWVVRNLEPLVIITIAVVAETLHLLHKVEDIYLIQGIILALLAVLGFAILHDRHSRDSLDKTVRDLARTTGLLTQAVSRPMADVFFGHSTSEKPFIQEAQQELWAVQETGALLIEHCKPEVISLLQRDRKVRLVVTAPTETTARLMSLRNAGLLPRALLNRAATLQHHIDDIVQQAGHHASQLTVRYLHYPVDTTCVIVDPHHDSIARRKALIRFAGFRVPFDQKLDFSVTAAHSPNVFAHCSSEVLRIYEHAAKVVLVCGPPRSGKTTLLQKMAAQFNSSSLFHALSPSTGPREERIGFCAVYKGDQKTYQFAKRANDNITYEVDASVWSQVAGRLAEATGQRKVILLDEIGAMQLRSPEFADFVRGAVTDPSVTIFATIAQDDTVDPIIPWLKRHHRSDLLNLDANNANEIEEVLLRELRASLDATERLINPVPA